MTFDTLSPNLDSRLTFEEGVEQLRFGSPVAPTRPIATDSFDVPVHSSSVALEQAVARAIDPEIPCFVEFSGGCDSSLILSLATRFLRSIGAKDPIPLTHRYLSIPETDESAFQHSVIDWLKLDERLIVDLDGHSELLSGASTSSLLRTGLVWPATLHTKSVSLAGLPKCTLLSGEGGDEVLGDRRATPIAQLARHARYGGRFPPVPIIGSAVAALKPYRLRVRDAARLIDVNYSPDWLDFELRQNFVDRAAATEPEFLNPARWAESHLARPRVWIGTHNLKAFAARYGVRWEAPLLDPLFLANLARTVSWHQYRGRHILLRHHFANDLPKDVLTRRTKVAFNSAFFGNTAREFAELWTGDDVPEGVDAEWLRTNWKSDSVHAGTAMLLQNAWLNSQRSPTL